MSEIGKHTPGPIWSCKIGTRQQVDLPRASDIPMRRAVEEAFQRVTGIEAEFNFSGWSAALTEPELAVVENRLPSKEHYRDWLIREAAPELYEVLTALVEHVMEGDDTAAFQVAKHAGRDALRKARGDSND